MKTPGHNRPLTPLRAIRKYCLSCAEGPADVRLCAFKDCALYIYRKGNNPARKGIGPGRVIRNKSTAITADSAKDSTMVPSGGSVGEANTTSSNLEPCSDDGANRASHDSRAANK